MACHDLRYVSFLAASHLVTLIDHILNFLDDRLTGQRMIAVTTGFAAGYQLQTQLSFPVPLAPTRQISRLLAIVGINYLLTLVDIVMARFAALVTSPQTGKLVCLPAVEVSSYILSRYWVYAHCLDRQVACLWESRDS